nr:hypothetical protein [Halomicroarcula sp. DFY41]
MADSYASKAEQCIESGKTNAPDAGIEGQD